jgi:hypothetical protein
MFIAVSSYLIMCGDVVDDGIVLMCRVVVTCGGGNVAVVEVGILVPCYPLMVMYNVAVMQGLIVVIVDLMFLLELLSRLDEKKIQSELFILVTGKQRYHSPVAMVCLGSSCNALIVWISTSVMFVLSIDHRKLKVHTPTL